MAKRLENKRCIITGAASGIGQATAILFAEHGCKLVLLDIAPMDETIKSIKKVSPLCEINNIKCDISSVSNIKNAVSIIENKYGKKSIDILINNAAAFIFENIMNATHEQWIKIINTNVVGAALMIKNVVPLMKYNGSSSIINLGSTSGIKAQDADRVTYNVTKAAIIQLTKNAAVDLYQKYKIRVNAVCPGCVLTKAVKDEAKLFISQGKVKDYKEYEKKAVDCFIMNHIGDPRDVAFACLFFASDDSKYCTGTNLMVDAGESAL